MQLLERSNHLAQLTGLLAQAAHGQGACAIVSGEAGIGKTALVRNFTENLQQPADILWGGCEALFAPRPLGPIVDMAEKLPPGLARSIHSGCTYNDLFPALLAYLRERKRPTVMVIDDAHWADEATLDCIKYLGRRIDRVPALMIITLRDDEVGGDHPLRRVLGDLPSASTRRIVLAPLSPAAVEQLARARRPDVTLLLRQTGGNPFYLTELLAAAGDEVPGSVSDAVLARVGRLGDAARRVVDTVSIEPARLERALVERSCPDGAAAVREAVASGVLREDAHGLAFRHEIARQSVESSLSAARRTGLHAEVLCLLQEAQFDQAALPRHVHHARGAGRSDIVASLAPRAAAQAARVGAHREAAALYRLALTASQPFDAEARATLLEAAACELHLINALQDAIELCDQALALRRSLGHALHVGVNVRMLGALHRQSSGNKTEYHRYAQSAVEVLEPLGPSAELAKAYATMSHVLCLLSDYDAAIEWGQRAVELAEVLDDDAARVVALNRLGAARIYRADDASARAQVERALALAIQGGFEGLAADIFVTLQTLTLIYHDHRYALDVAARGIVYCEARDMDGYVASLLTRQAYSRIHLGEWDKGERDYAACIAISNVSPLIRDTCRFALQRQAARRDASADDYWKDLQTRVFDVKLEYKPPAIAAACAEAAWLRGDVADATAVARLGVDEACKTNDNRLIGPLQVWLRRLDEHAPPFKGTPLSVYALELAGDVAGAATAWEQLHNPYEQALVLSFGDIEQMRAASVLFEFLGASRAANIVRAKLRALGERGLTQGPRRRTRADVQGLTPREREVFELLASGLSNDAIARRLHRSERTVEHHVSAVLAKVGVKTRAELIARTAANSG